jgi:hypothetical protein
VLDIFDGIDESSGGKTPPDVNAAVGASQIVEIVNVALHVYTKTGASLCYASLSTFLGTSDNLGDPRVQYDNVNDRYTFVVSDRGASPVMWVGATSTSDACGNWLVYRVTFSGSPFPAGTFLDFPVLGQDRNALLLSTHNIAPTSQNYTVFAIPKLAVYAGAGFSFNTFSTASLTAPVSNGGIPMISTPYSYFLGSVPGTGYRLYRLTNSGGLGATLTLQATISSPFTAPTRRVNQPGTSQTLEPGDGRIGWSPVNDGNSIWFAHGIDLGGFPSVRYGAINIAGNYATVAVAYHSPTSDDFNPSIGVGTHTLNSGDFVYLNWAYTDTGAGVATSDTVDSVKPGGGVVDLIGTGAVLIKGSSTTTEGAFGDYSSVAIDPTVATGSCAVTAQEYFDSSGHWRTGLARVGTCY